MLRCWKLHPQFRFELQPNIFSEPKLVFGHFVVGPYVNRHTTVRRRTSASNINMGARTHKPLCSGSVRGLIVCVEK